MNTKLIALSASMFFLLACNSQKNASLDVTEFEKKIVENNHNQIVDVRTVEEFENGHLPYALNFDINGDNFSGEISILDKDKPVFVYCQSGSRSLKAMKEILSAGFKEVYNLEGGIKAWESGNREVVKNPDSRNIEKPLSFQEAIAGDKLTLVDFYTDWCRPCKEMAPSIAMLKEERKADVLVVKVEAEKQAELAAPYQIQAYPTIVLFKKGKILFRQEGMLGYEQLNQLVNIYK